MRKKKFDNGILRFGGILPDIFIRKDITISKVCVSQRNSLMQLITQVIHINKGGNPVFRENPVSSPSIGSRLVKPTQNALL